MYLVQVKNAFEQKVCTVYSDMIYKFEMKALIKLELHNGI